jgi:hypothetical protein
LSLGVFKGSCCACGGWLVGLRAFRGGALTCRRQFIVVVEELPAGRGSIVGFCCIQSSSGSLVFKLVGGSRLLADVLGRACGHYRRSSHHGGNCVDGMTWMKWLGTTMKVSGISFLESRKTGQWMCQPDGVWMWSWNMRSEMDW